MWTSPQLTSYSVVKGWKLSYHDQEKDMGAHSYHLLEVLAGVLGKKKKKKRKKKATKSEKKK